MSAMNVPGRSRSPTIHLIVLAAAVLIVFLPTLRNGFVWDDTQYILENPQVSGGLTLANLRWALTSFAAGNWHPLTWISHLLDVELFGLEPWGPHLVNVLLHLGNTFLLFFLFLRLTGRAGRSFVVAALFAVHPLHVESVAWIAERKDLLSTLFGLLATLAYCRYVHRPGVRRYLGVGLLFAAGLAAKQMLVTLPCLLLLLDFWPLGRIGIRSWRRPVLEKLPLLVLATFFSGVAIRAQASAGAISSYPLAARLANALVSYCRYIQKTIAPIHLSVFYPHPQQAVNLGLTLGAVLVLAGVTLLALRNRRHRPWLAVGWFWFLGTLVPVIGLVQVGEQAMADRYSYVPIVGLFVLAVWGVLDLAGNRESLKPRLASVAAAVLAAMAVTSLVQVGHWRNEVTLFSHAVQVEPADWTAHFQLGLQAQQVGRDAEAIEHYQQAIRVRSGFSEALCNLGMIYARQGRPTLAVPLYRAAIQANPDSMEAYNNLGGTLVELGQYQEAESCLRQALRLKPDAAEPRRNLDRLLLWEQQRER